MTVSETRMGQARYTEIMTLPKGDRLKAQNAAMESFFSSLKTERVRRKTYRTRKQARADVFDYIECFYNPKRRHSTIGYLSPVAFEERTMKA